jgi:hypothetical protein
MSSQTSFCNSNNNKEDNIVSLLPECFLSHHPSRRVVHYSSKQIPSIANNCYDSKLMNKSKSSFNCNDTTMHSSFVLTNKAISVLNKGVVEYSELIDSTVTSSPSIDDVDDIQNISYLNLDDTDIED